MRERYPESPPPVEQGAADTTLRAAVRRSAVRIQHELNNPLAALLAEAQLLGMDGTLSEEHRQAVQRIVDLTRRIVATVRELEALGNESVPAPHDAS